MGIGVQALALMQHMQSEGFLRGRTAVVELGSQTFAPDLPAARAALAELFPAMDTAPIETPRDLYRALGFSRYVSLDLDGQDGALPYDLNKPLVETYGFMETFDLCTNHGTTEHAFDQFRCFENMHRLTRPGGVMLHALPSQGYQNHAFFNYHPSFFLDLASANNYEVLGLHYNIGEVLFPYTDTFLAERGVRATEFVSVFAVLRKLREAEFVIPFDGRYYVEERDGGFVPRSDVGSHTRVERNNYALSAGPAIGTWQRTAPRLPTLRLVLPVWGEAFVSAFLTFGLRALIESDVLEPVTKEEAEFLIVTDLAGSRRFDTSPMTERLRAMMPVRIIVAPLRNHEHSYDRLTRHYNLALADAIPGDRYVFMTADNFFSSEVLARVLQKLETHRLVLAPALRVIEETFITEVMGSVGLNLSGAELLRLALRHEHPLTEAFTIDNPRDLNHPLPAQLMVRLPDGYVGRWAVMHPLAVRVTNTLSPVDATIDWNYGARQVSSWLDVAVLDSVADGVTVTTTPLTYDQGEPVRRGGSAAHHLRNLKRWVNIPWPLEFHMAQLTHPVRLLTRDDVPADQIAAAEAKLEWVTSRLVAYVNSRRYLIRRDFHALPAAQLLRAAVDRRQVIVEWRRLSRRLMLTMRQRLVQRLRHLLGGRR